MATNPHLEKWIKECEQTIDNIENRLIPNTEERIFAEKKSLKEAEENLESLQLELSTAKQVLKAVKGVK